MPASLPIVDVHAPVCCEPVGGLRAGDHSEELERDAIEIAARLRALGDANRVRIILDLAQTNNHETCTCDIAPLLGVSEATANHHLKQLERAGLVVVRREGKRVFYRLDLPAVAALGRVLGARCGSGCC